MHYSIDYLLTHYFFKYTHSFRTAVLYEQIFIEIMWVDSKVERVAQVGLYIHK